MAVRTGVDLDIFQHLANAQAPIRTAKLAEMTGGEGLLIGISSLFLEWLDDGF